MGNPTVELVYAPATEPYRNDSRSKDVIATPLSILKAQEGLIKIYHGVQHEDKTTAYAAIVWESYEHHEKLMKDTTTYPKLNDSIAAVFDKSKGPLTMLHIKALEAPVVEIATFTLREGQSKSDLEAIVKGAVDALNTKTEADGVVHAWWGPVREKDNVLALFVGWTSVDAHWAYLQTQHNPEAAEKINALSEVALVHVPLAPY